MAKKSSREKQNEVRIKQQYQARVQNLMNLISVSTVAKQMDAIEDETDGPFRKRHIKWVVGDIYAVYSYTHNVYSIANNGDEFYRFVITPKDYRDFVRACNARRTELLAQNKKTK
ncbi:MAG: hypothetical protein IJQ90_00450 [Alphaproteobacteria bacterium]|nr:hypothetical protein [Alphaproteobacteria bacterium]